MIPFKLTYAIVWCSSRCVSLAADEWVKWATDNGINPMIIAFVSNEPRVMQSFLDYEKGGMFEGKDLSKDNGFIFNPKSMQLAYATPRSLGCR